MSFSQFITFLKSYKSIIVCGTYTPLDKSWIAFAGNLANLIPGKVSCQKIAINSVELNKDDGKSSDKSDSNKSDEPIFIIMAAQNMVTLPKNYICYQVEQACSHWLDNEKYLKILKESKWIIDYSNDNIKVLEPKIKKFGGINVPFTYVPFIYDESLVLKKSEINNLTPKHDIIFIGHVSKRRLPILQEISKDFRMVVAQVLNNEEWIGLVSQSKIVLNIHAYELDQYILETARLMQHIANECVTVSEDSTDKYEEGRVRDNFPSVIFTKTCKDSNDIHKLKETIKRCLNMDFTNAIKKSSENMKKYTLKQLKT